MGNVIDNTLVGLRLEINEANQRFTRTVPAGWPVSSENLAAFPKQCWVSKNNGDC